MSALPSVPLTVGASRVVRGVRVEHVCGDPLVSDEHDAALGARIVNTAIQALQSPVEKPTLFEPTEYSTKETAHVS
jgi:hypothetical protein